MLLSLQISLMLFLWFCVINQIVASKAGDMDEANAWFLLVLLIACLNFAIWFQTLKA